uniref:Costars domain-containing protein n=1 Tax=Ascaris lumbricoides TaxID=6252 RepID=A0A0M3ICH0_ASCLU
MVDQRVARRPKQEESKLNVCKSSKEQYLLITNFAGVYISREVLFLCETIEANAVGEHPNRIIKFGPLFYTYAHYSDKLVGMLLRARKYKLVDFEGEMLYQGQDDDKVIRMLMPIEEIRKVVTSSGDPVNCIAIVK